MNNKHRSWSLTLALLLCLCGCNNRGKTPHILVDIVEAKGASSDKQTQYPGLTEAREDANLSFRVMGTLQNMAVREGDPVRRGQVLASIDSRDYATQLAATQAEYRQVKAECERVIAMHQEQAVSDNDYDKAVSGLERIGAKLQNHQDQLKDCTLRAPYDGYVGQIYRSAGEAVAPGLPVLALFTAGDAEVVINVPEQEYRRRQSASGYEATFSALPGRRFPLTLKSVAQKANGNHLYQMRRTLTEKSPDVLLGMSVMVCISHTVEKADNRILVPVGALFNENGQSFVFLYEKDAEEARKTPVMVGALRADGMAEVRGALRPGDPVVASGVGKLKDGQKIKPLAAASNLNYGNLL